jgi:hypothetical protein
MTTSKIVIFLLVLSSLVGAYRFIFLIHGSKNIRKCIMHPIKHYHLNYAPCKELKGILGKKTIWEPRKLG